MISIIERLWYFGVIILKFKLFHIRLYFSDI